MINQFNHGNYFFSFESLVFLVDSHYGIFFSELISLAGFDMKNVINHVSILNHRGVFHYD